MLNLSSKRLEEGTKVMMQNSYVYLDHAATTPLDPEVLDAMMPYLTDRFASASTIYGIGRQAREAVEKAREQVAALIGAAPSEIYFTSGASESNNWVIQCVARPHAPQGCHIVTTPVEHHAILKPYAVLEREGARATYLGVDSLGRVNPREARECLTAATVLVCVMHANNEVGVIQPVEEIGYFLRESGAHYHVDAAQTAGHIPTDVRAIACDSLAMSAHKIYGPKGCGALFMRKGAEIEPMIRGGKHENGLRAGTHNVPGIVGFGKAAELARRRLTREAADTAVLRDTLMAGILERIEGVRVNGSLTRRLPNNLSVTIDGVESGDLIHALDARGICVSSGSACTSGQSDPSHVLTAMGVPAARAHGALRMTLGKDNTAEDIERTIRALAEAVARLREKHMMMAV